MKKINKTVSFTVKDTKLLRFASGQKMKFSPFVKELIREKESQIMYEANNSAELLKEILLELAEIKQELRSISVRSSPHTEETLMSEMDHDERDLSGLDDF